MVSGMVGGMMGGGDAQPMWKKIVTSSAGGSEYLVKKL
jgi:hypothetical protein